MSPRIRLRMAILLFFVACVSGCASLNSVSLTQVPVSRNRPIEASSSSWGFLGIFFSNSFVDDAIEDLRRQCPTGKITGVFTKHESRLYFIMLKREVTAKAYCEAHQKGYAGL